MTSAPKYPVLFTLSGLSVCLVKGKDASSFMQSQLSNDITHLNASHPHQLSAYCNPKGRILALFKLVKLEESYALIAPTSIMDKVLPRLKMFVMRATVIIEPANTLCLFGLQLPEVEQSDVLATLKKDSIIPVKLSDAENRFVILTTDTSFAETVVQPFKIHKATQDDWNRIDIEQNLPQLFIQNHEMLIPQSLNLDLLGGVNFKKGCYPGQEIIARIKYRGKPKTRMIGMQLITPDGDEVKIGAPIYIKERDSPVGRVINCVKTKDAVLMSITVPISHIESGDLSLDPQGMTKLTRLAFTYAVSD